MTEEEKGAFEVLLRLNGVYNQYAIDLLKENIVDWEDLGKSVRFTINAKEHTYTITLSKNPTKKVSPTPPSKKAI